MFKVKVWLASLALVSGASAHAAPLEAFGRLPSLEQVAMSPDGARVAIVWSDGVQRKLLLQNTGDHKVTAGVSLGVAKVRSVQWAGPQHLIITSSRTGTILGVMSPREEWRVAVDYNIEAGKLRPMLGDATDALNVVVAPPIVRTINGKPVVFLQGIHFVQHQGVDTLYRYNLDSGISQQIEVGDESTRGWVLDSSGTPVGQVLYADKSGRWSLKQKAGSYWHETKQLTTDDPPETLGVGRDGHSILIREARDGGAALREVAADGSWGEPLALQAADGPIFDPGRHNLIGYFALVGDDARYTFFDPADQKVWDSIRAAYPGQGVSLSSWSEDRRKVVVRVDSPSEGAAYALVNFDTREAHWLGGEFDKLTPADIAPVKAIKFKAKDGLELHGYLTVPRGRPAKDLPLVVFPHGGPAARDELGFDWWAQAMASRGYAVLQVNFRGSDGYGWDFLKAGFGEWGRKMQTDLSDGVRFLAAEGAIDPKRVCIVGASYGGYAALAGTALDVGVYRCAVSYGGISDLKRFNTWLARNNSFASQRYFLRFMGAESTKDPTLAEVSPVAHIDRVAVPVMLIHGKDDTVVPLEQSRIMADALKAAGKPVELVTLDSTDHWLTNGDTRLAMLQATMAFVEKNNPPN
ncbi:S9 family peptidase [Phenylobacterium sp.]|uniref:alpha/beta hydrolase family protein n=1 Tax=Phenylobacterium sp. TaxID=1871053 RepID=UPI002BC60673|nr:S9 family peptidase [Phenylobacterium sp.]HLZ74683.1 S9 family peptidase [Phenylobacterium sp.]